MLDTKILSAKTESAEGAWRRDLRELGHARGLERRSRAVLDEKHAAFWREVSRNVQGTHGGSPEGAGRSDLRILQAHRELRAAVDQYRSSQQGVQSSSHRAARSEVMVDVCRTMLGAERRRRASLAESRRGDEVQDLTVVLRAQNGERGDIGIRGANLSDGVKRRVEAGADESSTSSGGVMRPSVALVPLEPCRNRGSEVVSEKAPVLRTLGGIDSLRCENTESGLRLTVDCRCGPFLTPASITLSQAPGEGIRVVVMARDHESAALVAKERSGIVQRLQAAGLKIDRLTVEQGGEAAHDGGSNNGVTKRRPRRDEDEDRVA